MTNSLQGGEPWPGCAAAAPGSGPCTRCTIIPGGRLVFHVFAALAGFIRGLIVEGFALSGAATGQHGQAAALLAWLAAHQAPRSAQIPAASAECAVPAKTAISPTFGSPVSRLLRRQAQALPDLLLDDLRRGPRVHGVDVLLAPEDLQDGVGLVVIVPQPD
ncbi:MAG TPA: hypothetical protein VK584_14155, partial [Streptosporangiaceae bacterium]|nr:hypothetical protein [Streptosporangiaceae bacterium]